MIRVTAIASVAVLASAFAIAGCGNDGPGGLGTGGAGATGGSGGSGASGASGPVGPGAGGAGGDGGNGGAGGSAPVTCTLTDSGPIVVEQDGQVIENLHIVAKGTPAIEVNGHANVVIRNVKIEHAGAEGIAFSDADDILIENVSVEHTGAPPSGENPSSGLNNITCFGSMRPKIRNVRLTRGSTGIYILQCPESHLQFIEGHDFRGPFPRGQLVQWDKSNKGTLEDFSVINPQGTSWPEDNVNVYQSVDMTIRRGHIDGNNSPSGVGVIFDGGTSLGVVEDVDAIHMGNGCFSDYAGADGVIFRRTRCRENICEDQGRGKPLSNALMWAGHSGYSKIRLEDSTYWKSCNGNLVWPDETFAVIELEEAEFTMRPPIEVDFCWD
ncbi:right-handed parallel beta-helix repeat-containing protein [Polyangium aurulentum]|uniref:right-handed parallel beta-helix repeat-containing protein n=1 Tax=Polyangium aurulentum TaxID=2567896 RepID=UPI0010AEA788|nr:right-handed parallel beta-helix repeat-containing protein [Polyangium aurulentum]UQA58162.1 right-handed parallel beta-helix repeat-containing protein [Polyangium aurulentum]